MARSPFRPEQTHAALGAAFFDPVRPAAFPQTRLRFRNDRWAARIGLEGLSDADWIGHFGRFEPLPGSFPEPLALRYHGHQFRAYNPDLGDGRGFLFAQARDLADGRLLDLGTKGSGTTPWSRGGDGRLTLKGGVREILATEMLEALGVYTSKTLSLIETGEALQRGDEPSPTRSSVLVRLSHSHIRIGSFQRLAALGETDALRRLVEHSIAHFWPDAADDPDPVAGLYDRVLGAVAAMAAEWFAAGFVHGVINSDNVNITGESFDYGPWRFLDRFDPGFTAAYFDQTGLYAFARQPEALNWNLARLGECLLPLSTRAAIEPVFESFPERFHAALARQTFARLGLLPGEPAAARTLMHRFWGDDAGDRTALPAGLPRPAGRRPLRAAARKSAAPALRDRRLGRGDRGAAHAAPRPWTSGRPGPPGGSPVPADHGHRRGRGHLVRHRSGRRLGAPPRQGRPAAPRRHVQPRPRPPHGTQRPPRAFALLTAVHSRRIRPVMAAAPTAVRIQPAPSMTHREKNATRPQAERVVVGDQAETCPKSTSGMKRSTV